MDERMTQTLTATALWKAVRNKRPAPGLIHHSAYSTPNWTPIPRQTGHLVQRKLDTDSTANWTPSPAQTGHRFRSKLDSLKRPE